jgi:hypothetical protein
MGKVLLCSKMEISHSMKAGLSITAKMVKEG